MTFVRPAAAFIALVVSHTATAQPKEAPKGPKLPDGVTADRDVAYGTHERQKLDVYVPKGDGSFPLVLWVHGGGWEGGSKDSAGPVVNLLTRGYAVASTNYRLSRHAPFPAQIHDVKAAVRYLRANAKKYHLDPDRFGVAGGSAGGHLVALLGTSGDVKELEGDIGPKDVSSQVQCVIDFFGPTDLLRLSPAGSKENPVTRLLGGSTTDKRELAVSANPITYVSKDDPPFLIVHGDKDPVVPLSQSELLYEALKKAGVDTTLKVVPEAGHGNGIFTPELAKEYVEFFQKHLKKK
jgi:acetyl esterase/lipase